VKQEPPSSADLRGEVRPAQRFQTPVKSEVKREATSEGQEDNAVEAALSSKLGADLKDIDARIAELQRQLEALKEQKAEKEDVLKLLKQGAMNF